MKLRGLIHPNAIKAVLTPGCIIIIGYVIALLCVRRREGLEALQCLWWFLGSMVLAGLVVIAYLVYFVVMRLRLKRDVDI